MGSNPEVRRQPAHGNAVRDAFRGDFIGLAEAGEDVRALLAHPGWTHVRRFIDAEVSKVDALLDGAPLDSLADYRWHHGQRRGLQSALGIAHAIVSVADEETEKQRAKHERAADAVLGAT